MKKELKRFFDFLKSEGCLHKYLKSMAEFHKFTGTEEEIKTKSAKIIKDNCEGDPRDFLQVSFLWGYETGQTGSKNGMEWVRINLKWLESFTE